MPAPRRRETQRQFLSKPNHARPEVPRGRGLRPRAIRGVSPACRGALWIVCETSEQLPEHLRQRRALSAERRLWRGERGIDQPRVAPRYNSRSEANIPNEMSAILATGARMWH